MPTGKHYTAHLNWDFILDKIQEEQCLLILDFGNEGDDFFQFDDLSKQRLVCHDIKTYGKAKPDETLKLLANIINDIFLLAK